MNKRKLLILICIFLFIGISCVGIFSLSCTLNVVGNNTDFSTESLRWTIIGAVGSWAGSVFGAVALIISVIALWYPQRVKITVSMNTGFMISQMPGVNEVNAYVITVKNVSMKPITINNVYLHFGNKKQGDIFVGALNQNSVLQSFTPTFPQRVESGEAFDYYLLKDKLDIALAHYEEKTLLGSPLSIRVDEVTKGSQYYKTKWTLRTFLKK